MTLKTQEGKWDRDKVSGALFCDMWGLVVHRLSAHLSGPTAYGATQFFLSPMVAVCGGAAELPLTLGVL